MPAPPRLREHLARLYPSFRVTAIEPLAPDTAGDADATTKAAGYGLPVRVELVGPAGESMSVVWHQASSNPYGHDRRADRAAALLLAYDDFARVPRHVEAVDVGAMRDDGELVSLRDCGEPYLITRYAPGTVYADDLRQLAHGGVASALDEARVDTLAQYLAALHVPVAEPGRYRRAIRDLVGHGEGIYGIVDGYPDGTPSAPRHRLRDLEAACARWRWSLRDREQRLVRTHGDFHPFNVVFDEGTGLTVLDASRGCSGDPADDLTAMAINYVLFAFERAQAWDALGPLWHRFWRTYFAARRDDELLAVAPPFFAWRALVVCNPDFYPDLSPLCRHALLSLAERALHTGRLDPDWADELFVTQARSSAS